MDATIGAFIGSLAGSATALTAASIGRSSKISEFRQAWINELRSDISAYITKAHEWMDLYLDFNAEQDQTKKQALSLQLERLKYDSLQILNRIKLRFKINDKDGDALLVDLDKLLNPQALHGTDPRHNWRGLADRAVVNARTLLKTEWEKTKHPWFGWLWRWLGRIWTKYQERVP